MEPKRITSNESLSIICDNWLRRGWGVRHIFIGYSGSGKTYALVRLAEYLRHENVITIATDQKSRISPYDVKVCTNQADLGDVDTRSCVLRGFAARHRAEDRIDFDELARRIFHIAHSGQQVALVVDELSDAAKGQKSFAKEKNVDRLPWMDTLYRQGRELGASVVAATQLPQEIPRAAFSLSDTVGFFRQTGHESGYYKRIELLDDEIASHLTTLADYEFLLLRKGDPQVYLSTFK